MGFRKIAGDAVRLRDEPEGRDLVRCRITRVLFVSPIMDNRVLRLERRDSAKRMLRFYTLQVMRNLFGEWCLLRVWGRIGRSGQLRVDWFKTQQEAVKAMVMLELVKRKRGYREKQTIPSIGELKSAI